MRSLPWPAQLIFLCLLLFYFIFQATCSLSYSSNFSSQTNLCRDDQNLALLHFIKSLSIDSSRLWRCQNPKIESWKEGTDCCSWDGVTCEMKTGHVIGLNLRCSMLYGIFHSNSTLFSLRHLRKLDLSHNDFNSSHVSSQFGKLLYLTHLSLSYSNFAGQVPSEISHLSSLVSLDLSHNNELMLEPSSFNMLAQNLTKLEDLDLSQVNMSLVIPSFIMNLSSSLSFLTLDNCTLKGNFPGSMLHRSNLQGISLWDNGDLTGSFSWFNVSSSLLDLELSNTRIPIYLENEFTSNLKSLETLALSGCNIIRSNLALLGNLTQLTWLDLSYNNMSGQIPSSLANLKQLTWLDLSYNNMSGQIPSSLANLSHLEWLDLSCNNFSGQIPLSLAKLTNLSHFDLSTNRLIGPIPSQLSTLSNLRSLILYRNLLEGAIPSFLFALPCLTSLLLDDNLLSGHISPIQNSSLSNINLSHNNLDGPIPSSIFKQENLSILRLASNNKLTGEIPSFVCKLKSLQILDLSNNSLSGFVPQCLGNFSNSLSVLHLGANNLQGMIPSPFSEGNSLKYLSFKDNQLKGGIPPSIINCAFLELLDLGSNNIEDTFPYFLAMLPKLQVLVLRSNKLHGFVKGPVANYSFAKLRIIDLSNNNLSGPLPVKYFNNLKEMMKIDQHMQYMWGADDFPYSAEIMLKGLPANFTQIQTLFTSIDLSSNKFTGKIPESVGKLKALKQLNLSHNCLIGYIPPSLGSLTDLESLDLSSNMLTGRIPIQLVDITFLQVFNLSYNQLEGSIPQGKQFNTFGGGSYEGNLGLCGFPLAEECDNSGGGEQPSPSIFQEEYDWFRDGFGWKAVGIGYGCGFVFVFGISMRYVVFRGRRAKWFSNDGFVMMQKTYSQD